jgi:2-dehydropantoate 2-reductase
MAETLHHAILGPGGIGGLIGACLAHSGATVTLVVKPESLASYPKQINLKSPFGNFMETVDLAAKVPPVDVLWITVKATELETALTSITAPESIRAIVPLLNGIDHLARLRSRYGAEKIVPATIAVESERVAPGHIVHRTPFARLNLSSTGESLLGGTIAKLQQIGFECKFIANEPTLMWSKIVFLAPFALTTTAAERTTGDVIADPAWKSQLESCVREACAVAVAEGANVDADSVFAAMLKMPPNMRSSMQKDVQAGKPPELDAIAGPILRGARKHGLQTLVTGQLAATVERKAAARQGA